MSDTDSSDCYTSTGNQRLISSSPYYQRSLSSSSSSLSSFGSDVNNELVIEVKPPKNVHDDPPECYEELNELRLMYTQGRSNVTHRSGIADEPIDQLCQVKSTTHRIESDSPLEQYDAFKDLNLNLFFNSTPKSNKCELVNSNDVGESVDEDRQSSQRDDNDVSSASIENEMNISDTSNIEIERKGASLLRSHSKEVTDVSRMSEAVAETSPIPQKRAKSQSSSLDRNEDRDPTANESSSILDRNIDSISLRTDSNISNRSFKDFSVQVVTKNAEVSNVDDVVISNIHLSNEADVANANVTKVDFGVQVNLVDAVKEKVDAEVQVPLKFAWDYLKNTYLDVQCIEVRNVDE